MTTTFLGIEFAPLSIPLQRRLQTLAVLQLCVVLCCGALGGTALFLYLLFYTKYFYLAILYAVWVYYDRNSCHRGGRRFPLVAKFSPLWKHFNNYFPITFIKTSDLDPHNNYIFGYHPHGINLLGMLGTFMPQGQHFNHLFPGIHPKVLIATPPFFYPFSREYLLSCGIGSVSAESMKHTFTRQGGTGNAAVLSLGGGPEILDAHPHKAILKLKSKKGFVKLALRQGVTLVPVFAFGENDLYNQVSNPQGSFLRVIQNKLVGLLGLPLPLYNGRGIFQYTFGILPHRRPIYVVVGKPVHVVKTENPSKEQIDKYHAEYVEHLRQLFDEYKMKFGDRFKDLTLKIY